MNDTPHILVVDDEPEIRDMLDEYLVKQGYRVSTAGDGAEMLDVFGKTPVHLVLLDVNMPGEDGFTLARELREHHTVGIIMLTSASEVVDKVVGLEVGADDYVTKPFEPRELLARIKSVLRRMASEPILENAGPTAVAFGAFTLNTDARKLFDSESREIELTSMEFDLLKAFADNPNRVLERDRLLDLAGRRDGDPFDRSIDIRVSRIRRKIEIDPKKPQIIKTVHGVGYMFVP